MPFCQVSRLTTQKSGPSSCIEAEPLLDRLLVGRAAASASSRE